MEIHNATGLLLIKLRLLLIKVKPTLNNIKSNLRERAFSRFAKKTDLGMGLTFEAESGHCHLHEGCPHQDDLSPV